MNNYKVTVYLYGIKSAKTSLTVHCGINSTDDNETIKQVVAKHFSGQATIDSIKKDNRRMVSPGVGVPNSWMDK